MRTLFTLTLLLSNLLAYSQENKTSIDKIRNAVEQINKDSGYSKKVLSNDEFLEETTDGGGELTGYFKNGQLVKIREWIGLSSCINITEYYLQSNKLIFTYTEGSEFAYNDSSESFDYKKSVRTMECRFYFENGKLIKSILKGESRCSGKPDAGWSKDNFSACSRYQKLLKNK
jgi:hypothetical protein